MMQSKTIKIPIIIAALLSFTMLRANPGASVPPFDWNEIYLDENTLIIEETSRSSGPEGTIIMFKIKAEGFSPAKPISVWKNNINHFSEYTYNLGYPVDLVSDILIEISFQIENFASGQPLDIALVSENPGKRAHGKIIPFPIKAEGTCDCSAEAELTSMSGLYFLITFTGFHPEEEVNITNRLGLCTVVSTIDATEEGKIYYIAGFAQRARGKARITARSKERSVSLEYNVGKDAVLPQ